MGTDLLVLLAVFAGALGVGFLLISKVPPLLHTPLMSMTNAVSAVTVLGALLIFKETGDPESGGTGFLLVGGIAVAMAMFNVVGGFAITDRMLKLFKRHGTKPGEGRDESCRGTDREAQGRPENR